MVFLKSFLKSPRQVGSIIPSSGFLARSMASMIPLDSSGLVVELGSGTGAITGAIKNYILPGDKLVCLESSNEMISAFSRSHPSVEVLLCNASYLNEVLKSYKSAAAEPIGPVKAILSSLPLRSMDGSTVQEVVSQIHKISTENTLIIQFSYDLSRPSSAYSRGFECLASTFVFANIPPARVDVFRKISELSDAV